LLEGKLWKRERKEEKKWKRIGYEKKEER